MSSANPSLVNKTQGELKISGNICFGLSPCLNVDYKCQESDLMQSREVLSDPFLLDDPCVMKILSFLKPKELLESMEICQSWKQYIESSKLLMNRIYDGVILSFNFGEKKVVPDELRRYKHMSLKFPGTVQILLQMPAINANLLLNHYAPTLDTLRISHGRLDVIYQEINYIPSSFPMLRKLRFESFKYPFKMLRKSSFPALEVLHIKIERMEAWPMDISRLRRFLGNFPKLKHLMIEFDDDVGFFLEDYDGGASSLPLKNDRPQPQLETIAFPCSNYAPFTLRNQQNSLTKLSVCDMDLKNLSYCLRDLKKLRCLSIWCLLNDDDEEFIILPENDSIEVLRIQSSLLETDELSQVIFKLPSLKDLAVRDNDERIDIRFIASNMRHFKRLLVGSDYEEYSSIYREIQPNANRYINTSFVILNAFRYDNYYESFKEFDFK